MLTVFWNSEGVVLIDFQTQVATVNSECYIEALKSLKRKKKTSPQVTEGQKLMMSCLNKTMQGLTHVPPQLMPLYVWVYSATTSSLVKETVSLYIHITEGTLTIFKIVHM